MTMQADAEFLTSVFEEHLDEAEFLLESFEASLSSATLTLDSLGSGLERRLLAHVDALVVGGDAVIEQVLAPALETKRLPASRAAAVVVVLLNAHRAELATRVLWHKAPAVARAALRACSLGAGATLDHWILQSLATRARVPDRAPLLELAAERGLTVPSALESIGGEDAREITAALRTGYRLDPSTCERRVLELLEHQDPLVRDAALVASLHHGSSQGWARCQALALDEREPHPLAMTLLAGLGDPASHKRLAERLDSSTHRAGALRALGYSGNVGLVPLLVFHSHSKDARTAKLAAEAIATIVGGEVNDLVAPNASAAAPDGGKPRPEEDDEAKRALPPLEEDDLDSDLVPPAEAALPMLDAGAVSQWWKSARARFDVQRRYLDGVAATPAAFARALRRLPMRRRYLLSLLLSIRTGGSARVSTRAFTAAQLAQIAAVEARPDEAWARQFGFF